MNRVSLPLLIALAFTFGCLDGKSDAQGGCSNAATTPVDAKGTGSLYCGGKTYKIVKIGAQTWMAQNLNYDIPDNATDVCYDNKESNCQKYGRLYNWATAMALPSKCNSTLSTSDAACAVKAFYHRGICPAGWHIPNSKEWAVLINTATFAKLKAKSGWNNYDPCSLGHERDPKCKKAKQPGNGTDNYGFSALPDGGGNSVAWWSALEYDANSAAYQPITAANEVPEYDEIPKSNFFNVRCLKD